MNMEETGTKCMGQETNTYASSERSDKSVHLHSLVRAFTTHTHKVGTFMKAQPKKIHPQAPLVSYAYKNTNHG